ncbi:MAG TPA: DUF4363 family protein [Negativicutes bacterium]|nr:DUF4363 family protein [Negativicutes bacterium]
MKPLVIIIFLTILIVLGGCLTLYALGSESERLDNSLSALNKDIENQDWEAASKKLEEFHGNWDKTSYFWSMLIDHYEIDNIELVLSQLASFVKTKDKNQALSQVSSLKTFIKHIPNKEGFSLKNIF